MTAADECHTCTYARTYKPELFDKSWQVAAQAQKIDPDRINRTPDNRGGRPSRQESNENLYIVEVTKGATNNVIKGNNDACRKCDYCKSEARWYHPTMDIQACDDHLDLFLDAEDHLEEHNDDR
jgi:hypothetical protein